VDQGLIGIADTRVVAGQTNAGSEKNGQLPGTGLLVLRDALRPALPADKILLCFEDAFARETRCRDRLFKW